MSQKQYIRSRCSTTNPFCFRLNALGDEHIGIAAYQSSSNGRQYLRKNQKIIGAQKCVEAHNFMAANIAQKQNLFYETSLKT